MRKRSAITVSVHAPGNMAVPKPLTIIVDREARQRYLELVDEVRASEFRVSKISRAEIQNILDAAGISPYQFSSHCRARKFGDERSAADVAATQ